MDENLDDGVGFRVLSGKEKRRAVNVEEKKRTELFQNDDDPLKTPNPTE
jgi:hypothetical protein